MLVCIDVFSRFAFVRPIHSKRSREIIVSLRDIFRSTNRKPHFCQFDFGGKFRSKDFLSFLKTHDIEYRTVTTTLKAKCSYVERFNRTLRNRIMRYLFWKKTTAQPNENRYIDALQLIVDDYNKTKHSSINMAPENVTKDNSARLYETLRKRWIKIPQKQAKLLAGAFVRVKRKRDLFQKDSQKPIWSTEIFKIHRVIKRRPYPVYEIANLQNRVIPVKLYERELQKIELPFDTPIEIVKHANVFDKNMYAKTLLGNTRRYEPEKEKKIRKENNYSDVISLLK